MTLLELKARAEKLGITAATVAEDYGGTNKQHWQQAITDAEQAQANAALALEAEEENRQARAQQAYKSPSAPMVVPVAFGLAVGETLLRNVHGMLNRN